MIALRQGVPLIEVLRNGSVESLHSGHLVVCDADGVIAMALGDVTQQVFPRSCAKLLQAVGMRRLGFDGDTERLALSAASHSGEPQHIAVVERMLASGGLTEGDLRCPPEWPVNPDARDARLLAGDGPRRITMNCSGKHAAMLLTCRLRDWPISDYLAPGHPLQVALRATIEELTAERAEAVGVDGCGAPVVSAGLTGLARAFAGQYGSDIATAMRTRPDLVAGTGRAATRLMQAVPGLVAKDGAEGVFAAALPDGRAVAVKIDDGAGRAAEQAIAAVLRLLGHDVDLPHPILGAGVPVGELRPAAALRT